MQVTGGLSVEGAAAPASTRGSQAPGAQEGPGFSSFLDLAMAGPSALGEAPEYPDTGEDNSEQATGAEAVLAESLGAALQLPTPVIVAGPNGSPAEDATGTVDPVGLEGSGTPGRWPTLSSGPRAGTVLDRGTTSFAGELQPSLPQTDHPLAGFEAGGTVKGLEREAQSPGLSVVAVSPTTDETARAGTLSATSGDGTGSTPAQMAASDDMAAEATDAPAAEQQDAATPLAQAGRAGKEASPDEGGDTVTPTSATTASDPKSAVGPTRDQPPIVRGIQSAGRGEGNPATGTKPPLGEPQRMESGGPIETGNGDRGTPDSANLQEGIGASAGVRQSEGSQIPADDPTEAWVLRQLLPRLSRLSVPRNPQLRVHLTPPSLGPLDLHLRLVAGSLALDIMAATEQARRVLEGALPELRQYLESRGIEVTKLSLGMAGSSGDGTGAGANLAFASQGNLEERGKRQASPVAIQRGETAVEATGMDLGGPGRRNLVDYRV